MGGKTLFDKFLAFFGVHVTNLKMTLLENSISFFLESVSKAIQAESDEDKWKFAILLLGKVRISGEILLG